MAEQPLQWQRTLPSVPQPPLPPHTPRRHGVARLCLPSGANRRSPCPLLHTCHCKAMPRRVELHMGRRKTKIAHTLSEHCCLRMRGHGREARDAGHV